MLDKRYLVHGLNALSRAHKLNYFLDGHRGGAIISAVYFSQEQKLEKGVAEKLTSIIDSHWSGTPLCAPFPEEDANPALLQNITECMRLSMTGLREAGHNIILPSLALKAFHDAPETITPQRVAGICMLVELFTVTPVTLDETIELPDMRDATAAAEFILAEFVQCVKRFTNRGQGWSGHLLTHGKAIMDLYELGYEDLARQAEESYKLYISRIRLGPQDVDKPREEREVSEVHPLQRAYWEDRVGDLTYGHQLKYPYGFYGLLRYAQNLELKQACQSLAYRIF